MKALTFNLYLEQPILLNHPISGDENSSASYQYITGSSIKGALIGLFLRKHSEIDIARDDQCRRWFFTGDHCFLNAFPVFTNQIRALPKPLSWRIPKDRKYEAYEQIRDFAIQEDWQMESPVIPEGGFFQFDDGRVIISNPLKKTIPHNSSLVRHQKKENDSFIFQYEVLSAGQIFSTAILGPDVEELQKQLGLENGKIIFLGRSLSAEYGKTVITDINFVEQYQEYEQTEIGIQEKVTITLLSDAIFHDKYSNPTMKPDYYIAREDVQPILRSYTKTTLVGGFNRKWGLPIPQSLAVSAGSVFVYDTETINLTLLKEFAEFGIGERRADGFGRIAINLNGEADFYKKPLNETHNIEIRKSVKLSERSRLIAQQMAERATRQMLDQCILNRIRIITITYQPSNSQLSNLRQVVQESVNTQDLTPIRQHLKDLKQNAENQYTKAKVLYSTKHPVRLRDWLQTGLDSDFSSDGSFWKLIFAGEKFPSVAGETVQNKAHLQNEYIAKFLDALLKRAIRVSQRTESLVEVESMEEEI